MPPKIPWSPCDSLLRVQDCLTLEEVRKGGEERAALGFPAKLLDPLLSPLQGPQHCQKSLPDHQWGIWAQCLPLSSAPGLSSISHCAGQCCCIKSVLCSLKKQQCPNHLGMVSIPASWPTHPAQKMFVILWVTAPSLLWCLECAGKLPTLRELCAGGSHRSSGNN